MDNQFDGSIQYRPGVAPKNQFAQGKYFWIKQNNFLDYLKHLGNCISRSLSYPCASINLTQMLLLFLKTFSLK